MDPTLKDSDGLKPLMRASCASPEIWDAHFRPIFSWRTIVIPATVDNPRPTLLSILRAENLEAFRALMEGMPDPLDPETDRYNGSTLVWSYHFLSATTHQGRTCAHLDVDRNLLETLQFLADASIDLEGRNQWGMTALQLAQSNCRHEMHVSLEARGAAVMSGNAGGRRRDARHRDPESGLTSLQEAEEQLAEAVQDVNDELISWWDPTLMRNEGTFQAKIDRRRRW